MSRIVYYAQPGLLQGRSVDCELSGKESGRIRVLVVKKESYLGMLMLFPLTEAGCDVDVVQTAKNGLDLARTKTFDLVALDVKLPDATGLDLCSKLRQRSASQNAAIVFVPGSRPSRRTLAGIKRRAAYCIAKPVGPQLMAKLFSHVKRTRTATLLNR